ncbi:MAG TPA: 16S rRNA processing protein RimM, partial [Tissierellaceae bacterium]
DLNDEYLGELDDVLQGIGNDVYVIVDGKKEYLIPAVKEFIVKIDIDNKEMIIDPIDGMIE